MVIPEEFEFYGPFIADLKLEILERSKDVPNDKKVDVIVITPKLYYAGKITTVDLSRV